MEMDAPNGSINVLKYFRKIILSFTWQKKGFESLAHMKDRNCSFEFIQRNVRFKSTDQMKNGTWISDQKITKILNTLCDFSRIILMQITFQR